MSYLLALGLLLAPPGVADEAHADQELYADICTGPSTRLEYGRIGLRVAVHQRDFLWNLLEDESEMDCWSRVAAVLGVAESGANLQRFKAYLRRPALAQPANRQLVAASRLVQALGDLAGVTLAAGGDASDILRFLTAAESEAFWLSGSYPLIERADSTMTRYTRSSAARMMARGAELGLLMAALHAKRLDARQGTADEAPGVETKGGASR